MKKISAIAILALAAALLTAGCASTATLKKLEKQNVLLQKRLKQMQKRVYRAQRGGKPSATRPLPLPRAMASAGLASVHPDMADQLVGLPENAGFANRSPVCDRQPNLWIIGNHSRSWVKVSINGKPLVVVDDPEIQQLGLLPPNTEVKVCVTLKYRGVYGPQTTATLTAIKYTAPNPIPTPLPGLIRRSVSFGRSDLGMHTWID
jgi:hypothetical protein